jgi:hypothetical protein
MGAGALIQLVPSADGQVAGQMNYILGNPSITYFKEVHNTHTNFAMESIDIAFNNTVTSLNSGRNTYTATIGRNADLLQQMYLVYTLPDIYSDDTFRFQWIKNMSYYMIYRCQMRLGSQLVDELYGEWMDIWTELTLPSSKRQGHERMTGNYAEFTSPTDYKPRVVLRNNKFYYKTYPVGAPGSPSIPSRRYFVPLNFWFTRNPATALPLIALQYDTLEFSVEFRSLHDLYQLWDSTTDSYVSKSTWCQNNGWADADLPFGYFLTPNPMSTTDPIVESNSIDIRAYLECNFYYRDNDERKMIASEAHEYLMERVTQTYVIGVDTQTTLSIPVNNPIKEFVWITRRSDAAARNDWSNFSNSIPEKQDLSCLNTAVLLFNNYNRFNEKRADYFNLIEPYKVHTNIPRQGIYVYSFALHPEELPPSGAANGGVLQPSIYFTMSPKSAASASYSYEIVVYTICYNMFRIANGTGAVMNQI